jgi:hypothetical protein
MPRASSALEATADVAMASRTVSTMKAANAKLTNTVKIRFVNILFSFDRLNLRLYQ